MGEKSSLSGAVIVPRKILREAQREILLVCTLDPTLHPSLKGSLTRVAGRLGTLAGPCDDENTAGGGR